jgi:hypothetical protein
MSKVKFNVEFIDDNTVSADIEGKTGELVNLLANVLDGNEDLQTIFKIALVAVNQHDENDLPTGGGIVGEA